MSFVMSQVSLHRVLIEGVQIVKEHINVLDDIFKYYKTPAMNIDYGQKYIDQIKTWFLSTKIPVVQAWNLNIALVPQISVQLAQENEDEGKAALGDYWGPGDDASVGVAVFNVTLDIMLFGSKNTDEVLWMYYIVSYILFKRKRHAEALGLQQATFSASDYGRDNPKLPENIWVRTIKYRATVENFFDQQCYIDIDSLDVCIVAESTNDCEVKVAIP